MWFLWLVHSCFTVIFVSPDCPTRDRLETQICAKLKCLYFCDDVCWWRPTKLQNAWVKRIWNEMLSQFPWCLLLLLLRPPSSLQTCFADNLSASRQPSVSVASVWSGQRSLRRASGTMRAAGNWRVSFCVCVQSSHKAVWNKSELSAGKPA